MAILETAIVFETETILERKYYTSDEVLSPEYRLDLLKAVDGFASAGFNDEISSFSLGDFTLIVSSVPVHEPGFEENSGKLMMYSIVQKGMTETVVKENMNSILEQFLNRYSRSHLFHLNEERIKKMGEFTERIDKQFKDLALKPQDRFKKIF